MGVYFAVGVTARVEERVGRGVGEFCVCGVGLGLGVLVAGTGVGKGVLVAGAAVGAWGVLVAAGGAGLGCLVAVGMGVLVGENGCPVAVGGCGVAVEVGRFPLPGGEVSRGSLLAVPPPDSSPWGVSVTGGLPLHGSVEVGEGEAGVANAISSGRPVSGGWDKPSKSWMISRPITGTGIGISSTP